MTAATSADWVVHVFDSLSAAECFKCRLVCRAWRATAASGCLSLSCAKGESGDELRLCGQWGVAAAYAPLRDSAGRINRDRWLSRTRGHLPKPVVLSATTKAGALESRPSLECSSERRRRCRVAARVGQAWTGPSSSALRALNASACGLGGTAAISRCLVRLDCSGVGSLTALSVSGCGSLCWLSVPPSLEGLDCSGASQLRELAASPACRLRVANLNGCRQLAALPAAAVFSEARELDFGWCPGAASAALGAALARVESLTLRGVGTDAVLRAVAGSAGPCSSTNRHFQSNTNCH